MEVMLRFLEGTGLKFNFIIINSKDSLAREKINELYKRVNFTVYQESDQEPIWDILDGGKDDMFIYDR